MSPTSAPPGRREWLLALALLALAATAAYLPSFAVPELLDDPTAISDNPSIRTLAAPGQILRPPADSGLGGRPVANLTFALNYAWSGLDLRSYHALNLAIHVAAALALFGLVRQTLLRVAPADETGAPATARVLPLAFAAALLWSLHPALTIAVTYLSQRTESLMGLCYLLTLYTFARGTAPGAGRAWLPLSVLACFAGMGAKESMVTAPVAVLLYDRTFVAGSFAAALRARRGYYVALASAWLLLGVLLADLHERQVGFGLGVTWWQYALTECQALLLYLRLGVWPHPLTFDYGPRFLTVGEAVPYALVLAVALAGTAWALVRRPRLGFLAAWFFLVLAPTSSVVPVALQPIAENRLYLALAAVAVGLACGAHALAGRRGLYALGAVAVTFGAMAAHRNTDFRSDVRLWWDTLAKRPANARAHANYGQSLLRAGQPLPAIESYRRALALDPTNHLTFGMLGDALFALERLDEAAQAYLRAIELKPDRAAYYNNIGAVLGKLNRAEEAATFYRRAVELEPRLSAGYVNLADMLVALGRHAEALAAYEQAIALRHDTPLVRQRAALACLHLQRPAEAAAHFGRAAAASPDDANIRNNYGYALLEAGRIAESITQLELALRLDPGHAAAAQTLARARSLPAPPPASR